MNLVASTILISMKSVVEEDSCLVRYIDASIIEAFGLRTNRYFEFDPFYTKGQDACFERSPWTIKYHPSDSIIYKGIQVISFVTICRELCF